MNKYVRAAFAVPFGAAKMAFTKLFHPSGFRGTMLCMISPFTEISMDKGAKLSIGSGFKMRDGAKLRVRKKAECVMGRNVSLNSNDMIVCHERIVIGDDVQLSPNVQIYDHDHDFRCEGGVKEMKFRTAPVEIGSNVWIGANTVILRGTRIGDNCVVAAGSVIKGDFPANTTIIQHRQTQVCEREVNE